MALPLSEPLNSTVVDEYLSPGSLNSTVLDEYQYALTAPVTEVYLEVAPSLCARELASRQEVYMTEYKLYTVLCSLVLAAGFMCNITEIVTLTSLPSWAFVTRRRDGAEASMVSLAPSGTARTPTCFRGLLVGLSCLHLVYLFLAIPVYPMAHSYPVTGELTVFHLSKPYFLVYFEIAADAVSLLAGYCVLSAAYYRARYVGDGIRQLSEGTVALLTSKRYTWQSVATELKVALVAIAILSVPRFFETNVDLQLDACAGADVQVPVRKTASFVYGSIYIIGYRVCAVVLVTEAVPYLGLLVSGVVAHRRLAGQCRRPTAEKSGKARENPSTGACESKQKEQAVEDIPVGLAVSALSSFFIWCTFPVRALTVLSDIEPFIEEGLPASSFIGAKFVEVSLSKGVAILFNLAFVSVTKTITYMALFEPFREVVSGVLSTVFIVWPMSIGAYLKRAKETSETLRELELEVANKDEGGSRSLSTSEDENESAAIKLPARYALSGVSIAHNLERRMSQALVDGGGADRRMSRLLGEPVGPSMNVGTERKRSLVGVQDVHGSVSVAYNLQRRMSQAETREASAAMQAVAKLY